MAKPTAKHGELLRYPEMNALVLETVLVTFLNKAAVRIVMKEVMSFIRINVEHSAKHRFVFVQDGVVAATDDILLSVVMLGDIDVAKYKGIIARFYKPEPGQPSTFSLESLKSVRTPCL